METTLNAIREKSPCRGGWEKLLASLGKTKADDEPLSFSHILESNGIEDAIWALRVLDYKDRCLFLADVAESVLPIFQKHSDSEVPARCIQAVRDWHSGLISFDELQEARRAVAVAAVAVAAVAAVAAAVAAAAAAAADAAVADAAAAAASDDAYAAVSDAAYAAARKEKWKEIEAIFIKRFGGDK